MSIRRIMLIGFFIASLVVVFGYTGYFNSFFANKQANQKSFSAKDWSYYAQKDTKADTKSRQKREEWNKQLKNGKKDLPAQKLAEIKMGFSSYYNKSAPKFKNIENYKLLRRYLDTSDNLDKNNRIYLEYEIVMNGLIVYANCDLETNLDCEKLRSDILDSLNYVIKEADPTKTWLSRISNIYRLIQEGNILQNKSIKVSLLQKIIGFYDQLLEEGEKWYIRQNGEMKQISTKKIKKERNQYHRKLQSIR